MLKRVRKGPFLLSGRKSRLLSPQNFCQRDIELHFARVGGPAGSVPVISADNEHQNAAAAFELQGKEHRINAPVRQSDPHQISRPRSADFLAVQIANDCRKQFAEFIPFRRKTTPLVGGALIGEKQLLVLCRIKVFRKTMVIEPDADRRMHVCASGAHGEFERLKVREIERDTVNECFGPVGHGGCIKREVTFVKRAEPT
jgi:hypothetical protein